MANSIIQYAYVSGEISPTLFSRSDLEKYDLGLAVARNWIVDYRGGITTRPGSLYKDWLQHPDKNIRWFPFEFSPNVANTNVVVFGDGYIRFLQEGAYVLEADKTVQNVNTGTGAIQINSHGWSNGDLIKFTSANQPELLGRTFEVSVLDANNINVLDFTGNGISFVGWPAFSAATAARVYTLASPYDADDLPNLKVEQVRDLLRITHWLYPTQDLTRLGPASWQLSLTQFSSQVAAPIGLSASASAAGGAGVTYSVTAVDHNGNESLSSDIFVLTGIVNFTTTAGLVTLIWAPVTGAAYYNIFRSTVFSDGTQATRAAQQGFLGRANGATFVDTNIVPDFTKSPPLFNNPFANAAIDYINVTSGGTGYTQATVLTITDGTGTGAVAIPVVSSAGTIVGVIMRSKGANYTAPSISADIGTGATFSPVLTSNGTNFPAASAVFQQRQVYGGTIATPLGVWGSRPGRLDNFDISAIVVDNDSYAFQLDANKVSMIRHLLPMRAGLLVLNNVGVWQLTGGSSIAITPSNVLAEPQSYTGVSDLTPLKIETDILYVEAKGYTVRLLAYNDLAKLYGGADISVLSAHLFGKDKNIVSWTFAQEPYKLVHGIREDGYRLTGTILKEQNIYAWTLASTQGYYRQALSIREDNLDRVYFDVERIVQGHRVRFIEQEAEREFAIIEEAWALDSALTLPINYPNASLQVSAVIGPNVDFVANSAIFGPDQVGAIIHAGGGKARITSYVSPTMMRGTVVREITNFLPETLEAQPFLPGEWSFDLPKTTVSGLWHLEGKTVSIFADGSVMPPRVVTNGSVTLDTAAARVLVGLSYQCRARTLPTTVRGELIEGKRKRLVGAATRIHEGRGLKIGARLDKLYEFKDRRTESYGEPIIPRSEMLYSTMAPQWDENGQFYYVVDDPLPVTVLGHVTELEIGDDQG